MGGKRKTLVKRLKAEVQRAWNNYYNSNESPFPPNKLFKKKKKGVKKELTPAQIKKQVEENKAKRQAKLKRKAENIKKMEEQREAKRLKREAAAKVQEEYMKEQKEQKEVRQKLECFVTFDLKKYEQELRKKIDPKGNKIQTMSYNAVNKRFNIRFASAAQQKSVVKNATMDSPKEFTLKMNCSTLPAPVESQCVMFLYPGAANHPDKAKAEKWLASQADKDAQDLAALSVWKKAALDEFSQYGTIVNVYRERGFMVVYFSDASEAEDMMTDCTSFNGVSMVHKKVGTPTKADKNEVNKAHPMPPQKKKKKN